MFIMFTFLGSGGGILWCNARVSSLIRTMCGRWVFIGKRERALSVRERERVSTKTSFDSLWMRSTESDLWSRRKLRLLRMAPDIGTAK